MVHGDALLEAWMVPMVPAAVLPILVVLQVHLLLLLVQLHLVLPWPVRQAPLLLLLLLGLCPLVVPMVAATVVLVVLRVQVLLVPALP